MTAVLQNLSPESGRLVRVDCNKETELTRNGTESEVMRAAASKLEPIQDPESYMDADGGLCLYLDGPGDCHISLYAILSQPYTVLLRYVGDTVNESALAEDPQLYLYLMAAVEHPDVEFHDLDGDGFQEVLAWPAGDVQNLIIYDYYDNEIQKTNPAQTLGVEFAGYTGLIGNLQQEYSNMVEAGSGQINGTGIYQYDDGILTWVCSLEDALLTT